MKFRKKNVEMPSASQRKEDVPKEDVPKEDVPKEDVPKEDVPKEDAPKEDAPKEDVPRHVHWNAISDGTGGMMGCSKANEIIEEIITVLISRELTVEVAKRLLSETISSIDKEFVLEKGKIDSEII